MGHVGDGLRQAREAKGLTLEQVEEITKIRCRYLQALEEEEYDQLPGEVFVRGFLRNYAQALDLDPDEVLAAAGLKAPTAIIPGQVYEALLDEPLAEASSGQRAVSALIGLMAVIVVGLGGWMLYRYLGPAPATPTLPPPEGPTLAPAEHQPAPHPTFTLQPTETPPAVGTPTPTETPTPTATPEATETPPTVMPETGVVLRLEATQRSWVHVGVDGAFAYEGTMEPGQILEWRGSAEVFLRTGNAGGLRVWYNGQEEPPLGGDGQVVERTWKAGLLPPGDSDLPAAEHTPAPLGPPPEPGEGD
jgi:cytoskeletal protein RodZ